MVPALHGVSRLSHLGVIRAEGEDAAAFLQGQLTNDLVTATGGEARLAAYCSPKGRMLATFIGFKLSANDIVLVTSLDILAPTLKRLSMFVLRAKAKLRDATSEFALWGAAGASVEALAPGLRSPWQCVPSGMGTAIGLYPADGTARALLVLPAGESPGPNGQPMMSADDWAWLDVRAGIATLSAPVVDAFVPQMLNYESVGGVNFKKGCYPGQEVVARSQFRGTLKRRAFIAHCDAACKPGDLLFQQADAEQPCGTVAQSAASPMGGWDAIVSMQIAAAAAGHITLAAADGPAVTVQPAPYPLLEDL